MLNLPSITAHDNEPLTAENPAYQSRLLYRADDYSSLRYKLLQHLEEAFPNWNPILANKQGDQDFGVALIEMFSYLADILGFYADCRANEAFLGTATLPASLIELCRLIDYKIPPGASASALQAFFCKDGTSGTVGAGFKLKNKPDKGQPALVFETAQDLDVSSALNQLHLKGFDRSEIILSASGAPPEISVLLDRGYDGLKAASFIVITCPGKASIPIQLLAVADEGTTRRISWKPGALPAGRQLPIADVIILGKPKQQMKLADSARADEIAAGQTSVRVEQPAVFNHARFGAHYAPIVFVSPGFKQAANLLKVGGPVISWGPALNLALRRSETSVYSAGHWIGSCSSIKAGDQSLQNVYIWGRLTETIVLSDGMNATLARVVHIHGSAFGLAEPVSQAFHWPVHIFGVSLPDPERGVRGAVFTKVAPVRLPHGTTRLTLDKTYSDLLPGQSIVIADGQYPVVRQLAAVDIDGAEHTVLTISEPLKNRFKVADTTVYGPFELNMRVEGYNRATGSVAAGLTSITLAEQPAGLAAGRHLILEDSNGAEGVRIVAVAYNGGNTDVDLDAPLSRSFPLAGTVVLGNVAEITQGESVVENALGSGDQSQANQVFKLHQKPTTFVHDAAGTQGVTNTLQVFVGDELWPETESLSTSGPNDHHVTVDIDEDQAMFFEGGDGRFGAKFPTGINNISARYRKGLGAAGNVGRNTITVMAAPLPFLQSSRNPQGSSGGADPQDLETTRSLAPVTVRAIDRAVTLQDYRDLAICYAGIAKANARAERIDGRSVIDLVVATTGGLALSNPLKESLSAYLRDRGSPNHLALIRDYTPVPVRLALEVHVLPNFLRAETGLRIQKALGAGEADNGAKGYFNFEQRGLGQDLYLSEVYALVEAVEGVEFLIVKEFRREADLAAAGQAQDVVKMPPDGVATGGDALAVSVGLLSITLIGGIA